MSNRRFRSIGVDPATGKEAFVVARPGVSSRNWPTRTR